MKTDTEKKKEERKTNSVNKWKHFRINFKSYTVVNFRLSVIFFPSAFGGDEQNGREWEWEKLKI